MGVKTYTGPDGGKQKLSVQARRDKQARDRYHAHLRKDKRASAQTFEDEQGKGQRSDSDIHHTASGTTRRVSIAYNRATKGPKYRNEVKT